jgi:hypothetical protein
MANDKTKFNRENKHFSGELLRHKKHGYVVKLVDDGRKGFGRTVQLVHGAIPPYSMPFHYLDQPGDTSFVATCILDHSFESLNPAAKILFTDA